MFLYGASGHAKVIIDILKSKKINIEGIFDDNPDLKRILDYPVIGRFDAEIVKNKKIIISIGNNSIRKRIANNINAEFGTAIHSNSLVSTYATVNEGTVIMPNAIVQSGATICKHVIINTSSIIEHDCYIEDFVHVSPNSTLCGNVTIGEGTHIGAATVVIPGVKIGKWSIIGAGSVIIRDVPDNVIVVGNPGKILKINK